MSVLKKSNEIRIAICGGGGLGHNCAGVLSSRDGVTVDMLTNRPEKWNHEFKVNLPEGGSLLGRLDRISSDPNEIIPEADIVLFCLPATMSATIALITAGIIVCNICNVSASISLPHFAL